MRDEATRLAGGEAAIGMPSGGVSSAGGQPIALSPSIQRALQAASIDPSMMNSANSTVHIQTSMGTPDEVRAMMASFFGGANNGRPGGLAGQFMAGSQSMATTGVVRDVHDVVPQTPMPPGTSQADLTLDVRRPDGSTYPATARIAFRNPARRAAIATVGTMLPLLIDPNGPGRLTIDVGRLNLP
jgi:hypothetical protein